jgi:hypothetical protein
VDSVKTKYWERLSKFSKNKGKILLVVKKKKGMYAFVLNVRGDL